MNARQTQVVRYGGWLFATYTLCGIAALIVLGIEGCQRRVEAQWGTVPCLPVGQMGRPVSYSPTFRWELWATDPGRSYLYSGSVLVAGYCHKRKLYRTYDAATGKWSDPGGLPSGLPPLPKRAACECVDQCDCDDPCSCKGTLKTCCDACKCVVANPDKGGDLLAQNNFGLKQDKLAPAERSTVNGVEAAVSEAVQVIETGVPDTFRKERVVIIDSDAARRKQVKQDLLAMPECQDCIVQDYPPDHWHLLDLKTKQAGFFTGGSPTVYLMAADGKVLHRQDDYAGGSAAAAEAFRRARADYDPRRDPDRRKPKPEPLPTPSPVPGPAPQPDNPAGFSPWMLLLGVLAMFFLRRRSQ